MLWLFWLSVDFSGYLASKQAPSLTWPKILKTQELAVFHPKTQRQSSLF
jgi:hypothetical protein